MFSCKQYQFCEWLFRYLNKLPFYCTLLQLNNNYYYYYYYSLFVPESTRWLLVHEKYDAAMEQLQRICRTNRVQLPPHFDIRTIDTVSVHHKLFLRFSIIIYIMRTSCCSYNLKKLEVSIKCKLFLHDFVAISFRQSM